MKYQNWNLVSPAAGTSDHCTDLYSPLVSAIIAARGLPEGFCETERAISTLHSPALLSGIAQGAERVLEAIAKGERVAVYGDYDVDGITSTCLMSSYLSNKGIEPEVYIPDRLDEGYGLSREAIDQLSQQDITLIITVDCGISAIDEAAYARTKGIDIIITDHHECHGELPLAAAIIDPKKNGDQYPFKDLAGVGVVFMFICAIEGEENIEALFAQYGDLVTLGTVADMMPLLSDNRTIVRQGVALMNSAPRTGIAALMKEAGIQPGEITSQSISFALAPRLNAAGRMGSALLALELLSQEDPERARFLAGELGNLNKLRQKTETRILEYANNLLEEMGYEKGPIVLAHEGWHKGVVGIVAARLMRQYCEPVVLISVEDGIGKGSCRSMEGFNMFDALEYCTEHLAGFGGHKLAAGLTVEQDEIENLRTRLTEYYNENPPDDDKNALTVDISLADPSMISMDNISSLKTLEPFGTGNPVPILCISGAHIKNIIPMSGGKHVRITAVKWDEEFDCVFFSVSPESLGFRAGDSVDVAFTPQINNFRQTQSAQLLVSDVRKARGEEPSNGNGHETIVEENGGSVCPDRTDFARLYKYISGHKSGKLSGKKSNLLDELETATDRGSSDKYFLCLAVMEEMGLLTMTENGENIHIALAASPRKVDLEQSTILQGARQAERNGGGQRRIP